MQWLKRQNEKQDAERNNRDGKTAKVGSSQRGGLVKGGLAIYV